MYHYVYCLGILKKEFESQEIPDSPAELRYNLVDIFLQNHRKYGVKINRGQKKLIQAMKMPGCLPCETLFLVACDVFGIEIWVHHGMKMPVIYKSNEGRKNEERGMILHLQCISGIHFNPVVCFSSREAMVNLVREKNITQVQGEEIPDKNENEELDMDNLMLRYEECAKVCEHEVIPDAGVLVTIAGCTFCALVDTGAQVSLLRESEWKRVKRKCPELELLNQTGSVLHGIDRGKTSVVGVVELQIYMRGQKFKEIPFAIVKDDHLGCCCLLGANFLTVNEIVVDYSCGELRAGGSFSYPLVRNELKRQEGSWFLGQVIEEVRVRYRMLNDMMTLQEQDDNIRLLKQYVDERVPVTEWQLPCLRKFKRYASELQVNNGTLVRKHGRKMLVVAPFSLAVEVTCRTHQRVAHIGRHKLLAVMMEHFWHPALDEVARDVCASCRHCQLFKVHPQAVCPPVVKIQSQCPFELVAVDLLQLPKTTRGHTAVLMIVDHFSKYLVAVPLANKKGTTVVRAMEAIGLPGLLRIPSRVLSDNGPEFRCEEFSKLLNSYNIKHIYSTRYRAQGNGAVERCNRTIVEFIRGLRGQEEQWDSCLARAVIVYNNTIHSEIRDTPSRFLLAQQHVDEPSALLNLGDAEEWKPGHPRFAPFIVGQRVLLRISRVGNRLGYKLRERYKGPYRIKRMQSNRVSYEIEHCITKEIIKAHHKQLRMWNEPPEYLKPFIKQDDQGTATEDEEFDGSVGVTGGTPFIVTSSSEDSLEINSREMGNLVRNLSRTKRKRTEDTTHSRKKRRNYPKESTKPKKGAAAKGEWDKKINSCQQIISLGELHCSEEVNEGVKHSTHCSCMVVYLLYPNI